MTRHDGGPIGVSVAVRSLSRGLWAAAAMSLLAPISASAHTLVGDQDPNRPVIDYLVLGFRHMVGGWDHLLFIAGVVLLAARVPTAAKLITLFVAGHSLTLLLATLAGWQLNATAVDAVIALSLVYVGWQGWRGRPETLRLTGAIVFAFGLVHGLGLSTRLQGLGLPEGGLVGRILLFNVGVEIGQLVALAVIVGLGTLAVYVLHTPPQTRRAALGVLATIGLLAAAVISFPSGDSASERQSVARAKGRYTACAERAQVAGGTGLAGGHPGKSFYGPEERVAAGDLGHVVGDGYVVVRYRPDLPRPVGRQLRRWIETSPTPAVVAAPDPEQREPLRAMTAFRELRCSKANVRDLTTFRDRWFADLRAGRAGDTPSP
jgi:hydrogenase/urease accessory protein HupE